MRYVELVPQTTSTSMNREQARFLGRRPWTDDGIIIMAPVENENADTTAAAASALSEPDELTGRVEPVPMDGNCLFTAALRELTRLGLNGHLSTAAHMRAAIMDWVQRRGGDTQCAELTLAEWIMLETEESLENYVARLKTNGEWGGIIELYALTEMFDVCTCVYEPVTRSSRRRSSSCSAGGSSSSSERQRYARRHALVGRRASEREPKAPRVHLHYNGTSHYSIFVPDELEHPDEVHSSRVVAAAALETPANGVSPPPTMLSPPTASARQPASPHRRATSVAHGPASGTNGLGSGSSSGTGAAEAGAGLRRTVKSARSERMSSERMLSNPNRSGSSSYRQAMPRRRPTQPLPLGSLQAGATSANGRVLQPSSSRRRSVGATASTNCREQAARPLTSMRGSLSEMSQAVKLGLRLERGGPLPTRMPPRREVRV